MEHVEYMLMCDKCEHPECTLKRFFSDIFQNMYACRRHDIWQYSVQSVHVCEKPGVTESPS